MRTVLAITVMAAGGLLVFVGALQEVGRIWAPVLLGPALILAGMAIGLLGSVVMADG